MEEQSPCYMDNICKITKKEKSLKNTQKYKRDEMLNSIKNAIEELNSIISALAESAKIPNKMNNINNLLYHSLLMLIDELEYIFQYIEKIEETIDISIFDTAKKLNESIVNLIGHRKDIMFKILETSCKIHEYIIKQKKLAHTISNDETDEYDQIQYSN